MMFCLQDQLLDTVGLKINKEVTLSKDAVWTQLQQHEELFDGVTFDLTHEGMQYGFTSQNHAYKIGVHLGKIERIILVTERKEYRRLKMVVEYDGTNFSGFQYQSDLRSVQGEIEATLKEIHQKDVRIAGASRTDAGVHAYGQIVHFDTTMELTLERWLYFFQKKLPKDILITSIEEVHPLFHSRYDVLKKEYRYLISTGTDHPMNRNYEWHVEGIDWTLLEQELQSVIGTHDFTTFSKGEKEDCVRTIFEARLENKGDQTEIVFVGDGFLRYMIRYMVYTLVMISKGEIQDSMQKLLDEKSRNRIIRMAPAGGLYLNHIWY